MDVSDMPRLQSRKKIIEDLINNIPRFSSFEECFNYCSAPYGTDGNTYSVYGIDSINHVQNLIFRELVEKGIIDLNKILNEGMRDILVEYFTTIKDCDEKHLQKRCCEEYNKILKLSMELEYGEYKGETKTYFEIMQFIKLPYEYDIDDLINLRKELEIKVGRKCGRCYIGGFSD